MMATNPTATDDEAEVRPMVDKAMARFHRKLREVECGCGSAKTGKWAGIHEPGCPASDETPR